jgi:hypothetical protein
MDLAPEIRFGVLRARGRSAEELGTHVKQYAKTWTEIRRNHLVGRLLRDGAVFLGYLVSDVPPLHLVNGQGERLPEELQPGDVILTVEQLGQCEIVKLPA